MNELMTYVVGAAGAVRFGTAFLFALLGLLIRLTSRNEVVCQWNGQSAKWLINTLLIMYVMLRFPLAFLTPEAMDVIPEEFVFLFAVVLGFRFDSVSQLFEWGINKYSRHGKDS